jgi:alpha-mannosidase
VVLRFYEWAGKEGDVTVQLPPGARSASETDLMERPTGALAIQNDSTTIHTKPYEIKTLKVQFAEGSGTGTE